LRVVLNRNYRIWAYRKAAWTVDEWPESVAEIYKARGERGLRELPNMGKSIVGRIARWLRAEEMDEWFRLTPFPPNPEKGL
jgi:DNA polymerase (family 10)